jgi:thiol-disulfide isomerase/thioredoxin
MKRFGLWMLLSCLCLPLAAADAPKAAPTFSVKDLSGTAWTQASPAKGVLLLDLWATWCPPCLAEIPSLNALQAKYGPSHKLSVLGVCIDKGTVDLAKAAATKLKIAYAVAPGDDKLPKLFGVSGIPTAYVLKDGKILATLVGKHSLADFETELAPFLK